MPVVLHSSRNKERIRRGRVHWTILREGFAAVKMMEWPATQTNSCAVRIISLPASSFLPQRRLLFATLWIPFPRSEISAKRANLNGVVSFSLPEIATRLRSSIKFRGVVAIVSDRFDGFQLGGLSPRFSRYLFHSESFFLMNDGNLVSTLFR